MTHLSISAKKKAVRANSTTRPRGGSTSVGGRTGWPYESRFTFTPTETASRANCQANNCLSITFSFVLIGPSCFAAHLTCRDDDCWYMCRDHRFDNALLAQVIRRTITYKKKIVSC